MAEPNCFPAKWAWVTVKAWCWSHLSPHYGERRETGQGSPDTNRDIPRRRMHNRSVEKRPVLLPRSPCLGFEGGANVKKSADRDPPAPAPKSPTLTPCPTNTKTSPSIMGGAAFSELLPVFQVSPYPLLLTLNKPHAHLPTLAQISSVSSVVLVPTVHLPARLAHVSPSII